MSNLSLYAMTQEIEALNEIFEKMDAGEINETGEELQNYINELVVNKVDACVEFVNSKDELIELAKSRIVKLREFISIQENAASRFEEYVTMCMDKMGVESIKGKLCEIKKRKPSKVLLIEDENKVPAQFTTVETIVKIDKNAIKESIKSGLTYDGISLVDGKKSLSFKFKSGK